VKVTRIGNGMGQTGRVEFQHLFSLTAYHSTVNGLYKTLMESRTWPVKCNVGMLLC